MNERIRELAKDSGLIQYDSDGKMKDVEKFAELIVKDCALTAGLMETEGRKNIGAQLLDNFGINQ